MPWQRGARLWKTLLSGRCRWKADPLDPNRASVFTLEEGLELQGFRAAHPTGDRDCALPGPKYASLGVAH